MPPEQEDTPPDPALRQWASQAGRGRHARTPFSIPPSGLLDVAWRIRDGIFEDRILLVAAGAAFYLLLALFPALAAFVSLYGFVADPRTIADHIAFLGGLLPSGGIDIIRGQLRTLVSQSGGSLSIGFLAGLAVALWSANSGVKSLFEGMNVAYAEEEKRSFVRLNLVSFAFTLGFMAVGICLIAAVGVVPAALAALKLGGSTGILVQILRWPVLLVLVGAGITLLYRYGPSRERAKWRWLSWGGALATVVWLSSSWAFSFYLRNFADYNATYGTLGAVIGFLIWTWISVIVVLLGAELNAELEHQTAEDSTTGAPLPLGERGAAMADTIGKSAGKAGAGP